MFRHASIRYWFVGALIGLAFLPPAFDISRYTMTNINITLVYVIVLISLNLVYGLAGQVSLGHGALVAVGAYTSAFMTATLKQPFLVGLMASIFTGGVAGLLIGAPSLRLKSHYLAFATLAFGEIAQLLITNLPSVTHGSDGFSNIPPLMIFGFAFTSVGEIYYVLLAFVLLAMGIMWNIKRSRLGRALEAIREDELAAHVAGINVSYYKIFVFVVSAAMASAAGSLYAHVFSFISPDVFGLSLSVRLFAMVIAGGAGTISGSIIGAVLLTLLPESLRFSKASYGLIYGLAILFVMIFIPDGVVGGVRRLWAYSFNRNAAARTQATREALRRT